MQCLKHDWRINKSKSYVKNIMSPKILTQDMLEQLDEVCRLNYRLKLLVIDSIPHQQRGKRSVETCWLLHSFRQVQVERKSTRP